MKKFLLLSFMFIGVSAYVYINFDSLNDKQLGGDEGNYELEENKVGGVADDAISDTLTIGKIQTDYILYKKGEITFDEQVSNTLDNLKYVHNYPFNPQPNYLFSVGYDEDSAIQFYFLGNTEKTRTVIFRVEAGKKENLVSVIYDGDYFVLVASSSTFPNTLEAYDENNHLTLIEVE